jgi:phosphatidylserine/phosphatidylglycerophosphate/cardiolipin synthase-like enzyme
LNEDTAIVTSMNLYEFSQQRNNEMGILVSKDDDPELYKGIFDEVQRLLQISAEMKVTIQKVATSNSNICKGYCIRTGVEIDFNASRPFSKEGFEEWKKDGENWDTPEKFCHYSGNPSDGQTSRNRPILQTEYDNAKDVHGWDKCQVRKS